MNWIVEFHQDFEPEFDCLPEEVQDELLAHTSLLETFGPSLGRPHVDTLNGSQHANMKELRFNAAGGIWRIPRIRLAIGGRPECPRQHRGVRDATR